MDEQARVILYNQLLKFEKNLEVKVQKVIDWNKFLSLTNKEALEYVLMYRDKILNKLKKSKQEVNLNKFYIELPDMNFEGEDLSDIYLHTFMSGISKERNNGKKVFVTTEINLKNTGCIINLATIRPIIVSEDGINIRKIIADIKKCDFRGCKIFGKFQNSKAELEYTDKNLPEEYIKRLKEYEVPYEARITTDIVYLDMIERKIVKGTNGLEKVKQLVDFDLTSMNKDIWKYREVIKNNDININYTGAFIWEYGYESIGKENYYIDLDIRARDAYKDGNFDFIEMVYSDLDKETKKMLLTLALRDGKMKFVKRHEKELSSLQKKYLSLQNKGKKEKEKKQIVKQELLKEYSNGNLLDFDIDLLNAEENVRSEIVKEIYEKGNLKFVEKYLNNIDSKLKNEIYMEEYRKGNIEFIYRNFANLEISEIKNEIMKKELENKNVDFLCENYESIQNAELKEKLLKIAFDNNKIKFVEKHFEEYPKNMQMEAVIKFKDLRLPKEIMLKLLK